MQHQFTMLVIDSLAEKVSEIGGDEVDCLVQKACHVKLLAQE